jgi:hypothetical protein
MKLETNCYKCKHRKELSWSAHSACDKPDTEMTGNEHGKRNGWFNYPHNFDPIWRTKECGNFDEK